MSELKIPDEAYRLSIRAGGPGAAIDAAAPLIVAAELRHLTDEMDDWDDEQLLISRADELDPQGSTKE